jgi:hypothetical protein
MKTKNLFYDVANNTIKRKDLSPIYVIKVTQKHSIAPDASYFNSFLFSSSSLSSTITSVVLVVFVTTFVTFFLNYDIVAAAKNLSPYN